ncbi:hypothetical protein DOY81_014382 [Sarcophaga bullata]|nr:hypothetical protein DOY81_014382 [Sarcophaga bullata]
MELVVRANRCNDDNYNEDKVASSVNCGQQHTQTLLPPEEKQEITDLVDTTTPSNTVVIENFKSNDTSLDSAMIDVIALGQRMGLRITSHDIHDIFIYKRNPFLTYVVEFGSKNLKNLFLEKSPVLKNFRKTKFLTIS